MTASRRVLLRHLLTLAASAALPATAFAADQAAPVQVSFGCGSLAAIGLSAGCEWQSVQLTPT